MQIRHCEHCDKVFKPQASSGSQAIMCRGCATDCEMSFFQVNRAIRKMDSDKLTLDNIAKDAEISIVFVKGLIIDGKFDQTSNITSHDIEALRQQCKKPFRSTQQSTQVAKPNLTKMTNRV